MLSLRSDAELVQAAAGGDRRAFEQLVERHQAAVCGVAFSVVGEFARSEDVAQDAFVAGWRQLECLQDPARFKPWVCSIARNLALALVRREPRTQPFDDGAGLASQAPSPLEQLSQRDEERLLRQALAGLPDSYREPLVLFYLEDQSVERVAATLELSPDATKQRLSRGRVMLREEMTAIVQRALTRAVPGKAFTLAVLGALSGAGAATAGAGTVASVGKMSSSLPGKAIAAAGLGAWLGIVGGLLGAGAGAWFADRSMHYPRERMVFRRYLIALGIATLVFLLPFAAQLAGWWNPLARLGGLRYTLVLVGWQLLFFAIVGIGCWRMNRRLQRIVQDESAAGAAPLPSRPAANREGRCWTSRQRLWGWPLVAVRFAPASAAQRYDILRKDSEMARGWIAIGDRACGLFAFGQVAVGGVAFGGVSFGVLAGGGAAFGLVSVGGLAVGGLALGGLALAGFALGGLALGWLAVGGVAVAWRAAQGGLAIAHDFALGGQAVAEHANDAAARTYFADLAGGAAFDRAVNLLAPPNSQPVALLLMAAIGVLIGLAARHAARRRA